jgi:hypothetical protein
MMRSNVVRLWGGFHEARMRRPHENPLPRGHSAIIIQLPDLEACTRDEVRDMAKRFYRAARAQARTEQNERRKLLSTES